jgi:DNA-binding NarL/FixJ family response regulator
MNFDDWPNNSANNGLDIVTEARTTNKVSKASRLATRTASAPFTLFIVERNSFFRDCLRRSLAHELPVGMVTCASLSDIAPADLTGVSGVALLSLSSLTKNETDIEFGLMAALGPRCRCMVLAQTDAVDSVLAAMSAGAKGYISTSVEFPIFVETLRFVAAGGTYIPAQCLLAAGQAPTAPSSHLSNCGITKRELAVIQAIRAGKSNKVIAYELNMCESTVKVHVRHVMKKLHARNRTDVAMKGDELGQPPVRGESAMDLTGMRD